MKSNDEKTKELALELLEEELLKTESMAIATAQLKKRMRKQTILITMLLVITCAAIGLVISGAWYSQNKDVTTGQSTTNSEIGDTSLFITSGIVLDKDDYEFSTTCTPTNLTGGLFPVSMKNLTTWYYATSWSGGKVTGYTQVTPVRNAATQTDRYEYTDSKGTKRVAYNVCEYTVYTNDVGTGHGMKVYFNPTDPIDVEEGIGGAESRDLMDALRIGVVVNDTLKFVYAPAAESKLGNSSGATSGKFYAVTSGSTITEVNSSTTTPYKLLTSLGDYTASGSAGSWTADGATELFQATYEPTGVKLLVWLEGTDGDAMLGYADNASGVGITINLVGIPY